MYFIKNNKIPRLLIVWGFINQTSFGYLLRKQDLNLWPQGYEFVELFFTTCHIVRYTAINRHFMKTTFYIFLHFGVCFHICKRQINARILLQIKLSRWTSRDNIVKITPALSHRRHSANSWTYPAVIPVTAKISPYYKFNFIHGYYKSINFI